MQTLRISRNIFALLAIFFGLFFSTLIFASTTDGTIDTVNKYAWSNNAGWVNFGAANGNIHITDSGITGHAWNEIYGWINMDPANSGVAVSSSGALSGSAWGESLGWVNFSGTNINCSGGFSGTVTGDAIGTLTFDCANCAVSTDYRPQSCRGGGPSFHSACNLSTHKCTLVAGQGADTCTGLGSSCCDPHGDINWTGAINLTDFSLLMVNWGLLLNWSRTPAIIPPYTQPPYNECADITHMQPPPMGSIINGEVNLSDFSIMLYWWTE